MSNKIKYPKFAVAIDHNANYHKGYSHYALKATKKEFAFMEAMKIALKSEEVFCFHVLQYCGKGKYKSLAAFHKDARGYEVNEPWIENFTFDIMG